MADIKKLLESIDRISEAVLPADHPDWKLSPAERIEKQNARIAADSSAEAEVWHKGMKVHAPTLPVSEKKFIGNVHHSDDVSESEDDEENYRTDCLACNGSGQDENGEPGESCVVCGGKGYLVDGEYDDNGLGESVDDSDQISIGRYVFPNWDQFGHPMQVIAIVDDQRVKVKDDFGNVEIMFIKDLEVAESDYEPDEDIYTTTSDHAVTEDGALTEELRVAFEDYVKNKAAPADEKTRITITYKDGHTQTKLVTDKERKRYETASSVEKVEDAKSSKGRLDDTKLSESSEGIQFPSFIRYAFEAMTDDFSDMSEVEDLFDYAYLSDIDLDEVVMHIDGRRRTAKSYLTQAIGWLIQNIHDPYYKPTMTRLAKGWIQLVADPLDQHAMSVTECKKTSFELGTTVEIDEAKGPTQQQEKDNAEEWAKIESHWKKIHGNDVQMPSGPAGDQRMRQRAVQDKIVDEALTMKDFDEVEVDDWLTGDDKKPKLASPKGVKTTKVGVDTYRLSYNGKSIECSRREIPHYKQELTSMSEGKKENRKLWDKINSKGTVPSIDRDHYTDLSHEGLEGPYRQKNGKVLYYDTKAGKYYDRDSDFYVSDDDYFAMNEGVDANGRNWISNAEYEKRGKVVTELSDKTLSSYRDQAMAAVIPTITKKGDIVAAAKHARGATLAKDKLAKAAKIRAALDKLQGEVQEAKDQIKCGGKLDEAPIDQVVADATKPAQPAQSAGAPATNTSASTAATPASNTAASKPATPAPAAPAAPAAPINTDAAKATANVVKAVADNPNIVNNPAAKKAVGDLLGIKAS